MCDLVGLLMLNAKQGTSMPSSSFGYDAARNRTLTYRTLSGGSKQCTIEVVVNPSRAEAGSIRESKSLGRANPGRPSAYNENSAV